MASALAWPGRNTRQCELNELTLENIDIKIFVMQEINHVFLKVKAYCLKAPSRGFVSFETIATDAGVTRTVLKTHLEQFKKLKLITYSATGNCFLMMTKLGLETKNIAGAEA